MISREDQRLIGELCSEASDKGNHVLAAQCSRVLNGNHRRGEDVKVLAAARVASDRRRRELLERLRQDPSEGWKHLYVGWQDAIRSSIPSLTFWEHSDFQDVPVTTPENSRISSPSDPAFDFWRIALVDRYRRGLRKHGRFMEWPEPWTKGISRTAELLGIFRNDPEARAAAWISACLWELVGSRRANSGPSPEGLDQQVGHCALHAAWWRLRESKREDAEIGDYYSHWEIYHHAMSDALPCTPYGALSDSIKATTLEEFAALAVVQFVWVRAAYQPVCVYHVDEEVPLRVVTNEPSKD
jgi:hypothetical protein